MRDPNVSLEFRIKVAQATLPFVHGKLVSAPLKQTAGSAKLIDGTGGFTVDDASARVEGLGESPEKRARSRIFELELKTWCREGPSAAEQIELDVLRGLYPDVPLDRSEPMYDAIQAWDRALNKSRTRDGDG